MNDTSLTMQSLPNERYLYLLGVAISTFSSNNGFIIENILHTDSQTYNWGDLIDLESGKLKEAIHNTITDRNGDEIENKFIEIVKIRNRIIHGFRITSRNNEQILGTKDRKTGEQFEITEEYLENFIKLNAELSSLLHEYRGH